VHRKCLISRKDNVEGRRLITGATVGRACASTIFAVVFSPEMLSVKNILLRILLGVGDIFAAIAISFGITRLFRLPPLTAGSALLAQAWYLPGAFTLFRYPLACFPSAQAGK
jgi:hypothetical protein